LGIPMLRWGRWRDISQGRRNVKKNVANFAAWAAFLR
jgi:hypothetical protein